MVDFMLDRGWGVGSICRYMVLVVVLLLGQEQLTAIDKSFLSYFIRIHVRELINELY